jgi:trigger factor
MSATLEKKENNMVTMTIDVPPEDFAEALQRSFRKNINHFSIPGFRRGKAPMNIVMKYYGEGVLYDDAIEFAATPAYSAALAENGLEPVDKPDMEILEIGRTTGLKFKVTVTVEPEVTLGQYRGVEAVKPEFPVTDEDVARELSRIQERNSRLVPVEGRPVQEEDTANIDYEGFVGDVPFEGGKGASYDLRIGSKTFIPGFEEQLIGHNQGDEFDLEVTFPEDYNKEELKGKVARFHVKINTVKMREMPVLDDEFAKDVSEFDTLAEYRESLRNKLADSNRHRADSIFEDNVVQAVVSKAAVDIPAVMIDHEVEHMVEDQKNQMKYQGIELDQYLGYIGQTMDQFTAELREPAASRVKTHLVLHTIAEAEKVEASEADIEAEVERMATQYGMKVDDLKARLAQGGSGFITENVIHRKTVELLTSSAVATAPQPVVDLEKPAEEDASAGSGKAAAAKETKKRSRKKNAPAGNQPEDEPQAAQKETDD